MPQFDGIDREADQYCDSCRAIVLYGETEWSFNVYGALVPLCASCAYWCDSCDETYTYAAWNEQHQHEEEVVIDWHDDLLDEPEGDELPQMRILGYSHKPAPIFFGDDPDKLYFGVEHEMELPTAEAAQRALQVIYQHNEEAGEPFYVKSDGSLSRNGFEMVSHPFSRSWFDESYPGEMVEQLHELRAGPTDTYGAEHAGIHIHVSRAAFTAYHTYKFMHFHYEFYGLVQRVAGRANSSYASFDRNQLGSVLKLRPDGKISKTQAPVLRDMAKGKTSNPQRYMAVNMQNESTMELRYFRSTSKIGRLRAYVQFVDAVYHYTKEASISRKAKSRRVMSEADFLAYLNEHAEQFPDVLNLLNRVEEYRPD